MAFENGLTDFFTVVAPVAAELEQRAGEVGGSLRPILDQQTAGQPRWFLLLGGDLFVGAAPTTAAAQRNRSPLRRLSP